MTIEKLNTTLENAIAINDTQIPKECILWKGLKNNYGKIIFQIWSNGQFKNCQCSDG